MVRAALRQDHPPRAPPARAHRHHHAPGRGEAVLTDGPFVEGKEVVSGYAEVEVADLDEALAIARTWPACPLIEIRPLT